MEYQPVFHEYPQVDFRQGVPKTTELEEMCDALIIFEDMEANGSLLNVFTHTGRILSFTLCKIFPIPIKKAMRSMSQCSALGLFLVVQYIHLARPVFPHNSRFAVEAYSHL